MSHFSVVLTLNLLGARAEYLYFSKLYFYSLKPFYVSKWDYQQWKVHKYTISRKCNLIALLRKFFFCFNWEFGMQLVVHFRWEKIIAIHMHIFHYNTIDSCFVSPVICDYQMNICKSMHKGNKAVRWKNICEAIILLLLEQNLITLLNLEG